MISVIRFLGDCPVGAEPGQGIGLGRLLKGIGIGQSRIIMIRPHEEPDEDDIEPDKKVILMSKNAN